MGQRANSGRNASLDQKKERMAGRSNTDSPQRGAIKDNAGVGRAKGAAGGAHAREVAAALLLVEALIGACPPGVGPHPQLVGSEPALVEVIAGVSGRERELPSRRRREREPERQVLGSLDARPPGVELADEEIFPRRHRMDGGREADLEVLPRRAAER